MISPCWMNWPNDRYQLRTQNFVSNTLPNGASGAPYNQTLTVSGGTLPYNWSVIGSLPAGLSLSQNGTISGTPAAPGPFSFTVQVADLALRTATQTFDLTIDPNSPTVLFSDNFSGNLAPNWTAIDEGTVAGPSSWIISYGDVIQQSEIEDPIGNDEDGLPPIDPAKPGTFLLYTGDPSAFSWQDYDFCDVCLNTEIGNRSVSGAKRCKKTNRVIESVQNAQL